MDNVETMFSTRIAPWHKKGNIAANALSSQDALIQSGLDWNVVQTPVGYSWDGVWNDGDGLLANVRETDGRLLGVVSNRYKVVQNREAFDFTDALFGTGDIQYETAGSLDKGKTIWLLAKMPDVEIVNDKTTPYLVFTNSHDGKRGIRAFITPVRVVCQNTLNLALNTTRRSWGMTHMGDMGAKLIEARQTLQLAKQYMLDLSSVGNFLSNKTIDTQYMVDMSNILFPIKDDDSNIIKQRQTARQTDLIIRWTVAPDLNQFRDTKWGIMNAVSDSVTHAQVNTGNNWEKAFADLLDGSSVIDKAYEYVLKN